MSGPKVIRVVTREELIARCNSQLARLDVAIDQWIRSGRRNDVLDETEIAKVKDRRETIRKLIDRGHFSEALNATTEESEFLRTDGEQRIANAINAATRLRVSQRQAAANILAALTKVPNDVPVGLRARLDDIASGYEGDSSAIREGIGLLSSPETGAQLTQRQLELAESLKESGSGESFKEWLATEPVTGDDAILLDLDRRLGEIRSLGSPEDIDPLESRMKELYAEPNSPNRSMKIDSLAIDAARILADARERHSLQASLQLISAELRQLTPAVAQSLLQELGSVTEATRTGVLEELLRRSEAAVKRMHAELAAAASRKAVMEGLAGLGYNMTEGMATAWVRDGQIVMRNASQPGYGVELLSDPESGRLQARAVAFSNAGTPRDRVRDKDIERSWCETLYTLGRQLASGGGKLTVEKSLVPGQVPLKLVTLQVESKTQEEVSRDPRKREL